MIHPDLILVIWRYLLGTLNVHRIIIHNDGTMLHPQAVYKHLRCSRTNL